MIDPRIVGISAHFPRGLPGLGIRRSIPVATSIGTPVSIFVLSLGWLSNGRIRGFADRG